MQAGRKTRFLILPLFLWCFTQGKTTRLHLLFTNDIHGAIHELPARFINPEFAPELTGGAGAFTYLSSVREDAEKNGEYVLLTDGGNIFQGTPLGTRDGGATIIRWMNWMEYDVLAPGIKDFDQGKGNITRLASQAKFPFLSANLKGVDGPLPYIIKEYEGISIGIIGLMTPELPEGTLPENIEGVQVTPPLETLNAIIPEVREKGADLIFVLAHMGLPYDREDEYALMMEEIQAGNPIQINTALELAHFTEGVDVIIAGGISKGYNTPWQDPSTHTLVLQNYGNLSGIGHLIFNIDVDKKTIEGYSYPTDDSMLLTLFKDDIWPDPEMADSIRNWVSTVKSKMVYEPVERLKKIRETSSIECPEPLKNEYNRYAVPALGKADRLEVMTWNMEYFPTANDTTLKAVAEIIRDLNVDIIGIQEIKSIGQFAEMMSWLPDYDFVLSRESSFMDQAIVYRSGALTVLNRQEPFTFDDYYFAGRPPLVVDLLYRCGQVDMEVTVVNFHLKCCGDGLYRRQQSMKQMHAFLRERIDRGLDNIIVIGDWNDQIQDKGLYQSFRPFIQDREHFRFVTELIADDPEQQSYPTWPSFLDHILISHRFFDAFNNDGVIRSVNIDEWIGGWEIYESTISDHRPILLTLPLN